MKRSSRQNSKVKRKDIHVNSFRKTRTLQNKHQQLQAKSIFQSLPQLRNDSGIDNIPSWLTDIFVHLHSLHSVSMVLRRFFIKSFSILQLLLYSNGRLWNAGMLAPPSHPEGSKQSSASSTLNTLKAAFPDMFLYFRCPN